MRVNPEVSGAREAEDSVSIGRAMVWIAGIHPVREALVSKRPLDRVLIARGLAGPRVQELIDLCRQGKVAVRFEPREALDRLARGVVHQGVLASAATQPHAQLEDLVAAGLPLVALDGVEDPHNLGAILRTAYAAGIGGAVLPERRAAGLTEAVAKASAGAISLLPVARVTNLSRALAQLKQARYWVYGLDERGTSLYEYQEFAAPAVFVLGGEGKGLHEHVRQHCDWLVRIPMAGQIASLNVSVAAGVVLFEWRRRLG